MKTYVKIISFLFIGTFFIVVLSFHFKRADAIAAYTAGCDIRYHPQAPDDQAIVVCEAHHE